MSIWHVAWSSVCLFIYKFTKSFIPWSTSTDSTIVSTNINKVPKWFFCGPKSQMKGDNWHVLSNIWMFININKVPKWFFLWTKKSDEGGQLTSSLKIYWLSQYMKFYLFINVVGGKYSISKEYCVTCICFV